MGSIAAAADGCGRQVGLTEAELHVVAVAAANHNAAAAVAVVAVVLRCRVFVQEVVQGYTHYRIAEGVVAAALVEQLSAVAIAAAAVVAKAVAGRLHSKLADLEVDNSR